MTGTRRPIVVGYDGSPPSHRALVWALEEARLTALPVRLVHVYEPAMHSLALGYGAMVPSAVLDGIHAKSREIVEKGLVEAREYAPDVEVEGHLVAGTAASTLLGLSDDAHLLVVGSRGLGGFRGLLLGSVSHQVGVHAKVPVVVLRGDAATPPMPDGPVVVGLDGSATSLAALAFGFDLASRHGRRLVALHAWELPVYDAPGVTVPPSIALEEIEDDEMRVTAESLGGWRETFPDVEVEQRVVHGPAERVMIEASEGAAMVVVGSRGRGGFTGLLLGSVGLAVLHHSRSPVAVVRPG